MRSIYWNRKIMLLYNVTQTSVTYFSHANTTRLIVKTVQLSLLGRERNTYFNSCLKAVLMNWCSFRIISRFYTCMYVRLQLSVTYLCLVKIPSKVDMKILQYTKERKIISSDQQTFFIFEHFLLKYTSE